MKLQGDNNYLVEITPSTEEQTALQARGYIGDWGLNDLAEESFSRIVGDCSVPPQACRLTASAMLTEEGIIAEVGCLKCLNRDGTIVPETLASDICARIDQITAARQAILTAQKLFKQS